MGAEADQFEAVGVGFAVDQDEVGADVAVAVVGPVAGQGVVDVAAGEGGLASNRSTNSARSASSFLPRASDFSWRSSRLKRPDYLAVRVQACQQ